MLKKNVFRSSVLFLMVSILASCSPFFHQPLGTREAELGTETPMKKELLDLPEPQEQIVVAVYKFRDQTGQYKPSETGASWSTAVTQGATNILIRALEESGWFIPIERENISNLLNERQIIRSSREQYEGGGNMLLPPLLFAGVLLEGGIVSYESNVFTGGAGVRYFGTDASAQYREDRVTIYLRAISTSNGKVLKTVYTTKSILSQEVSMGVFRYVKFKRLLEAETGYTYNEPTDMAVTEAIEKGIHSLIIEGVLNDLWALKDSSQENSQIFKDYLMEKESNFQEDIMSRAYEQNYRGKNFITFSGSALRYNGDYSGSAFRPAGGLSYAFSVSPSFFIDSRMSAQQLMVEGVMEELYYSGDVSLVFMANTLDKYSPYISAGAGAMSLLRSDVGLSNKKFMPYLAVRGGMEYHFGNKTAVFGEGTFNQFLYDDFDGSGAGTFNDSYWGFGLGLRIYF